MGKKGQTQHLYMYTYKLHMNVHVRGCTSTELHVQDRAAVYRRPDACMHRSIVRESGNTCRV